MEPEKKEKKRRLTGSIPSPTLPAKDPSLSHTKPTTSRAPDQDPEERITVEKPKKPFRKKCLQFLYNEEENTYCGRTCKSWFYIIVYSIVYICFLTSYTSIFLYGALWCIRLTTDFRPSAKIDLLTYSEQGIGLTLTPLTESYQPVIWYRSNVSEDYDKYVNSLDLLVQRRKRDAETLGPCGVRPYGYDSNQPCIVVRINKQLGWTGKPLESNSSLAKLAPVEVKQWMVRDKKLWLHCSGIHLHDKKHIGRIRYYPYPPGYDPKLFPLEENAPLIAVQISNFTLDVTINIGCKLWYAERLSPVNFMLHVASYGKTM